MEKIHAWSVKNRLISVLISSSFYFAAVLHLMESDSFILENISMGSSCGERQAG